MEDYRVNLDIYNGPLDLLLYLIRREEVDICDIPIARITEQFVQYIDMLQQLDPNLAGEFLVLAASLVEIKTRMLLPTPPPEEGGPAGLEIDPRAELVRQLLEYKAFKDAAGDLRDAAAAQSQKFPRRPSQDGKTEAEIDLEAVQVWNLLDAFSKLMEAIGHRPTHHEVIYDDTPVELHIADILDRLRRDGTLTFNRVFEGRTNRDEIVGLFLAMLELIRRKKIAAIQDQNFGQIVIHLRPEAEEEAAGEEWSGDGEEPPLANSLPAGAPTTVMDPPPGGSIAQSGQTAGSEDSDPAGQAGRYVSDSPATEEEGEQENVG